MKMISSAGSTVKSNLCSRSAELLKLFVANFAQQIVSCMSYQSANCKKYWQRAYTSFHYLLISCGCISPLSVEYVPLIPDTAFFYVLSWNVIRWRRIMRYTSSFVLSEESHISFWLEVTEILVKGIPWCFSDHTFWPALSEQWLINWTDLCIYFIVQHVFHSHWLK